MIPYSTEQYVPCLLPSVSATIERTTLSSTTTPLYLQHPIFASSMYEGWRLESPKGIYLLNSLDLIRSIEGKPASSICTNEGDLRELEQFYACGLIGYESKDDTMLRVFTEGEQYRNIYRNGKCGWFSMIPIKIELDLTSVCNFACKHCSRETTRKPNPEELRLEELIEFIEQSGQIGVSELTFMGGEPTCHPELIELALVAKLSGVRYLSVGTNGWLLDEKLASRMAAVFNAVQVSLHGTTAAMHDNVVGRPGSFERSIQGIRYLKNHSAQKVIISFTVLRENVAEMETAACLARDLGVDNIRFLLLTPKGRGVFLPQWNQESRGKIGAVVRALHEKYEGELVVEAGGTPPYLTIPQNAAFYGCAAGRTLMYVSSQGEVKPCAAMSITIGNIRDSPILELWHSKNFVSIREAERCRCSFNGICSGNCLAGLDLPVVIPDTHPNILD
jgi:radical SAM protein with 4Fe4S-binding SPASM domain